MILHLTGSHFEQILQHAGSTHPAEACGLIGGVAQNGIMRAVQVIPITNRAADPHHHYHMDAAEQVAAMMRFEASGLSLISIYHSHPAGDPIPSPEDIRASHYPRTPYLIIGTPGSNPRCAAWEITEGAVTPVEIYIGSTLPLALQPEVPSRAMPWAIIASALIAAIFMIVMALTLLPPAPEILR